MAQFRYFRKLVNRERKACRGKYDELKIQHLRRKPEKVGDEMKTPRWRKDFPQWFGEQDQHRNTIRTDFSTGKPMPSIPLSSNRSASINYKLLSSGFLSSLTSLQPLEIPLLVLEVWVKESRIESRIETRFSMTTSRFSMSASRFSMFSSRFSYSIPARLTCSSRFLSVNQAHLKIKYFH